MGQVNAIQGIIQFVLHAIAVTGALAACGLLSVLTPRWKIPLAIVAAFAVSFAAHIVAFIALGILLGENVPPEIHRPVVGIVWGLASGLTVWLVAGRWPLAFWSTAFLTTCAYYIFVLLRPALP
jgi:hypothetical protein